MNKFKSLIVKAENKRRKGFTLIEIMVACAIIIALSVGAFFGYSQAQQSRKMAQMRQDMEAICTAALAYEAMSTDSTPPADIASLSPFVTAAPIPAAAIAAFILPARADPVDVPADSASPPSTCVRLPFIPWADGNICTYACAIVPVSAIYSPSP